MLYNKFVENGYLKPYKRPSIWKRYWWKFKHFINKWELVNTDNFRIIDKKVTLFQLNPKEENNSKNFRMFHKGPFIYSFCDGSGIGITVCIEDYITGIKENITDYDSW